MNGRIKLKTEWTPLQGIEVENVNGTVSNLSLLKDEEYYLQVQGTKYFGELGVYFWYGEQPTTNNTIGAELLTEGKQGYLKVGIDSIYVRGAKGSVDLIIRKVQ